MFGCLVAGRLVQTNLEQVAENKFVFKLEHPEMINHLVVFLLGTTCFPPEYAATVHFKYPQADWVYLGAISNEKPSAIFKLGKKDPASSSGDSNMVAELGISVEPAEIVASAVQQNSRQLQMVSGCQGQGQDPVGSVSKILQSLYDYLMSFAVKFGQIQSPVLFGTGAANFGTSATQVVPVKAVEDWYKAYLNKIKRGDA